MKAIRFPRALFILAPFGAMLLCLGCAAETGADGELGEESEALCKGARLGTTAIGPVTGSVPLMASPATCAAGETAEYRFGYQRDGTSNFVEVQSWSLATTATWDTTGLPSGSYHVYVHARRRGSPKVQSSHSIVVLVGQVCNDVTLATDVSSPQSVGAPIGLVANATCTGGTPEYQFLAKPVDGATVVVQDWSPNGQVTWETASAHAGPHRLTVSTRARNNLGFEAQRTLSFRLGETCRQPMLTATPPSPAAPGDNVELSATASCTGQALPEYRFSYHPSATETWTVLRDWSGAASITWPTTALGPDDYQLRIETRANDYAGPRQASRVWTYVLGPWCRSVSLNITPKSPPALNAVLTLTGDAACDGAAAEYRFWSRAPEETAYTELRGWGPATATFDTTDLSGGSYAFKVQARAIGNASTYQAQRAATYRIGHVCSKVTLTSSPKSPTLPGTAVGLQATATCANQGVPEYQFTARAPGSDSWALLRDWGSASSFTWDTGSPPWNAYGDYQLRVAVRGQGQLGGAESTRTITHALQAGCLADSVYEIQASGSWVERESTYPPSPGVCGRTRTGSYQATLRATVSGGSVDVVGSNFAGRYDVIENTATGFTAMTDGSGCDPYGEYENTYGHAILTFNCATSTVSFDVSCIADTSTDGCYPNYSETVTGSGSRVLSCNSGYHVSGDTCVDDDECTQQPCEGNETCTNTPGSFTCSCVAPAETCNGSCVSLATDTQNCGACGNACGSGEACEQGTCRDLDECATAHPCSAAETCTNQPGSYVCSCESPAQTCDAKCVDPDSDSMNCGSCGNACGAGAECSVGSCVDIDECTRGWPCDLHATCTNIPGSFTCACNPGYAGDGRTCTDVNECTSSPCQGAETCVNSQGSYSCACNAPARTCSGQCVNTATDPANCGACGVVCTANQRCAQGTCTGVGWSTIDAGSATTCGLRLDRSLACWGVNAYGQTTPQSGGFLAVSTGQATTCGVHVDGTVSCWGQSLGVAPAGTFSAVAVGDGHACALRMDGSVACWGLNDRGQASPPDGTFVAVSAKGATTCGLRPDATLACWGVGTAPAGTFLVVEVGPAASCGVRTDHTLACWDDRGSPPQFGEPPSGTFTDVAVSYLYACGLRTDGTLACWSTVPGYNQAPPSGEFADVTADSTHTCALRTNGAISCWGWGCRTFWPDPCVAPQ